MSQPNDPQLAFANEQFLTLLDDARGGSTVALDKVLGACRQYLLAIANQELPDQLRAKVAASDLVQDSCFEAHQAFAEFRGKSREELFAWLRTILLFNISNARRHYETAKRQTALEMSLDDGNRQLGAPWQLAAEQPSPSQAAMANEEQVLVEQALQRIPEHLRQAILMRHQEHLSFAEIGQRLDRSADAARKLWARGIEQLQRELQVVRTQKHD